MPLIKSAIKKMRQDKARTKTNRAQKEVLKKALKQATLKSTQESLATAFSKLDRAAKKGLIPKGRADRIKSRLAKSTETAPTPKTAKKTTKSQKSVVVKTK